MKTSLLSVFIVSVFSLMAQSDSALTKLQNVYVSQVAWENAGELTFDQENKLIFVKNFSIPVSRHTHLKFDKKKGNIVIFSMQNYTVITDVNDPSFKRASFEIPFRTKDGAVSFITYFNNLIAEN